MIAQGCSALSASSRNSQIFFQRPLIFEHNPNSVNFSIESKVRQIEKSGHLGSSQKVHSNLLTTVSKKRASYGTGNRRTLRPLAASLNTEAPAQQGNELSREKMEELIEYLNKDLPKLFDKGELDKARFEVEMYFEDPITKYDTVSGYLFNIQMLRILFQPIFELQKTYQSAANEITTRWTMTMDFRVLPWRPQVVFTGLSIYGINPATGRFNSHIDVWDSIQDQKHFSLEGLRDLLTQSGKFYTTIPKDTPTYHVLVRRAAYEVRRYDAYVAVEATLGRAEGLVKNADDDFQSIKRYASGQNQSSERLELGLPFVTETSGEPGEPVATRAVLPRNRSINSFPAPLPGVDVRVVEVPPRTVAVARFGGTASNEQLAAEERALRALLLQDSLGALEGVAFARYNDFSLVPSVNRNEVHIPLEDFSFDQL